MRENRRLYDFKYCLSKKLLPILYSKLLYQMGYFFLEVNLQKSDSDPDSERYRIRSSAAKPANKYFFYYSVMFASFVLEYYMNAVLFPLFSSQLNCTVKVGYQQI